MIVTRFPGLFLALGCCLSLNASAAGTEGYKIDLKVFTVEGIGLSSSAEDVRRALGPPEEQEKLSKPAEDERDREKKESFEKREKEDYFTKVVYEYPSKGIRIVFREDMSIHAIEIFISEKAPYEEFKGSFVQPIPLEVREIELLRPLVRQIYKDKANALYLKKDEKSPLRESAVLLFNVEGWLRKITFTWEENFDVDLDRLCVAGVCLGDDGKRAIERFGPPDRMNSRGKRYVAEWNREGLRIYAKKKGGAIYRIIIMMDRFDGGFVQSLGLTHRKEAYHDYLAGRIYQEGSFKICAYRAAEPLSREKLILKFDDDERLRYIFLDTIRNIKADLRNGTIGTLKAGDSPKRLRRIMGPFSKGRELRDSYALAYPRYGMLVTLGQKERSKRRRDGEEERRPRWSEFGDVESISVDIKDLEGLYAVPVPLIYREDEYKEKAAKLIFREKGDAIYLSADGRAHDDEAVSMVTFEKSGWPMAVTLKIFDEIIVDMSTFTVAGIGLGTHADEVLRVLGQPDKVRTLKRENLAVFSYIYDGVTIAIDRMDRGVAKITLDMKVFEGSFVQDLTRDSHVDDYERELYKQIYKQGIRKLRLTTDGKKPTWEEAVIEFSLVGRVRKISFMTQAVKKEGLWWEITRDLK